MNATHRTFNIRSSFTGIPRIFVIGLSSLALTFTAAPSAKAVSQTNGSSEVFKVGAGETVQRSFTATQGNLIIYVVTNPSREANLSFTIHDLAGKKVDNCGNKEVPYCVAPENFTTHGIFIPPATGTYVMDLLFLWRPAATGNVGLSLTDVILNPPPTLSGTITAKFLATDVARVYQFTATQGKEVTYGIANNSRESRLYLHFYNSAGTPVSLCGEVGCTQMGKPCEPRHF